MSVRGSDSIAADARSWVIRLQDPGFADWDAFAEWLERDPLHLSAYDAAVEDDRVMAELFHLAPAEPVPARRAVSRRFVWAGGAVAAAVALVVGWTALDTGGHRTEIATRPGEQRTVRLADGSRVTLNGGTRIALDADEPRTAELVGGEALFEVRHDANDPFVVLAGDVRLQDAGTVFNVIREAAGMRVAVAEGAVIYAPGQPDEVRLDPGEALAVPASGGASELGSVAPADVGSWRAGQLVYRDAALAQIARDLSRNLGRPVHAGAGTERIRFTGTLSVRGDPEAVLVRAASLTGTRVSRADDGWTLDPIDGAPR